jgi:hypothetical protein
MRGLPTPMGGLNPSHGLSTTHPVATQASTSSFVMVRASNTRQPIAGGKILTKLRHNTQGKLGVIDGLGIGFNDFKPSQKHILDEFVIKIPNSKEEYFIPGSYVRSNSTALLEVTESYANVLNVSADELKLVEIDLTAQFDAIRLEFSEAHFTNLRYD